MDNLNSWVLRNGDPFGVILKFFFNSKNFLNGLQFLVFQIKPNEWLYPGSNQLPQSSEKIIKIY